MIKALAYFRTSSATNVGGDSDVGQRSAIEGFAAAHGITIVGEYYDAAVSGTDAIENRPGFAAMLERIESNGVRLILVEDATQFARSVLAQELGILVLRDQRVSVVTASGDDLTDTDDDTKVMWRQVASSFSEYEKKRIVAKLKAARDRASAKAGYRIEGSKIYKGNSAVLKAVRDLRASLAKPTLQAITDALAKQGHTTTTGRPLALTQVARIVKRIQFEA